MPVKPRPLAERFWRHAMTIPEYECWDWTGSLDGRGYGQIQEEYPSRKLIGAHRASYLIHIGEIPDGLVVRHTCDNPICTRPEHLILGTQADNMQDASRRGRMNPWKSKVTHCKRGHAYDEENTTVRYDANRGYSRRCKACRRKNRDVL